MKKLISDNLDAAGSIERDRPRGGLRFDWVMVALCGWLLGGLYLDGWAHNHLPELETFFTPWHAVLYSGMFAVSLFLVAAVLRNHAQGHPWRRALPAGYALSLLGVLIFAVGGLADMIWHILFGVERSIEALLSPTHLLLALGGSLIVSGPLRSAWRRSNGELRQGWASLLPMLLSLAFLLSVFTFFTQFAHPLVVPVATQALSTVRADSEIYVMNADGSGQTRLTVNPGAEHAHPSWFPDRSKIAFTSERDGNREIYVMNADGSGQTRLTNNEASDSYPSWSPDGGKIAFVTRRDAKSELYVMNADGSSQTRLTTKGAREWPVSWSPDSNKIAFTSTRDEKFQIYVINADGHGETRLTEKQGGGAQPSWSLDGSKFAFASDRDGNVEIYVMNADGSGVTRLTNHKASDVQPAWSPDGRKIVFVTARDRNQEIYVMNVNGSGLTNLTNNSGTDDSYPAWSRDGGQIAFTSKGTGQAPSSAGSGQALGIASILLQTGLLMGLVLPAMRRWALPLGGLTLVFTVNAIALSFMEDRYLLVTAGVVAGLVADLLLWQLKPSAARPGAFRLFALAVPVVFYGSYFLVLRLTEGVGWSVHLWMGAIVLAGMVGWLLSYVVMPPKLEGQHT